MDGEQWVETNRAWWDERAPSHAASDFYDIDGFRSGASGDRLRPFEGDELGVDPAGLDLVHLQCHVGTDTLSWARRGARVTGVDFSAPALDVARGLAADIGIDATFVESDVVAAPAALDGATFDVVYTGLGALSWLPDIEAWAQAAAALVRPGGVLYVVEIHPFLWPFDDTVDEPEIAWPYFGAVEWSGSEGSYTDRTLVTSHNETRERNWGFGAVLTAVVGAGLTIELVAEHAVGIEQVWPWMVPDPAGPGLWRVPPDRPELPLTWSFRARRPA